MLNYRNLDPDKCDFVEVANEQEILNGERLFLEVDDLNIVVFNISGEIFAIGDVCTHDDGPLGDGKIDKYEIICPRHGARFDIKTGKAQSLPAVTDIPVFPVRVVAGQIEVGIPNSVEF